MGRVLQAGAFHSGERNGQMTSAAPLRRVVTITLDPSQDIGDLEAGPVFSDEYTSLVVSDDPSDFDRLLYLDGIQETLVTDYLDAWARVAGALAARENVELYLVIGSADEDTSPDPLAADLKARVSKFITVSGGGDAWFVTETPTELRVCGGHTL